MVHPALPPTDLHPQRPISSRDALRPKLLTTLRGYTRAAFFEDVIAGLVVGVVALPLAIAFAIASGVPPEKGLITAVVAGFIISALGGSRVQIGGPTGAFVIIVYGIVQKYGLEGLTVATMMAGVLLIAMGLARFGSLIKFIPYPVIVGFTSGIGVIIATSEIKDFFGLRPAAVPADFFAKWAVFLHAGATVNVAALELGVFGMVVILLWPRVSRRIPGSLVALVLCTVAARLLHLHIETIGSHFGGIPHGLPRPGFPAWHVDMLRGLVQPAITIALLAGIESLLSATVADGMIGTHHRSNMELVAQGVANVVCPLFGGIPATGAIARTATNIKNGGRTPVAGIVHALTLLVIMLVLGRYAAFIPLCVLAAILLVVAYNMSEWRVFRSLLRGPRADALVLLLTFGLTVAVDLTVAIEVGLIVSMLLFIRQMSEAVNVNALTQDLREEADSGEDIPLDFHRIPEGVEVYEINGPLFFGAAQKFEETLTAITRRPRVLVLRLRNLMALDATGLHALERVHADCRRQGIALVLSGLHTQPFLTLHQSGLAEMMGQDNLLPHFDAALQRAASLAAAEKSELS